ncbi:MAG: class I SAM-dependent methyltransferase [Nanoarchaeota archaeon]
MIYKYKNFFKTKTIEIEKGIFKSEINKLEIEKYYSNLYWNKFSNRSKIINLKNKIFNLTLKNKSYVYESDWKILKKYSKINPKKELLEIGCGEGKFLKSISKKIKVYGIEPDIKFANSLKKDFGDKILNEKYDEINLKKRFDVIYLRHVFEHFFDYTLVLNKLKNNLKKEGIIYINIPNCENERIMYESVVNHPHIWHFTLEGFKKTLEKQNFQILHINTYSWKTKNKHLNLIKSFFKIGNLKLDKKTKGEFIIAIIKNEKRN